MQIPIVAVLSVVCVADRVYRPCAESQCIQEAKLAMRIQSDASSVEGFVVGVSRSSLCNCPRIADVDSTEIGCGKGGRDPFDGLWAEPRNAGS